MEAVPVIGRLHPFEYLSLIVSLMVIGTEFVIRIITLALPRPVISFAYRASRRLFHRFSQPQNRHWLHRKRAVVASIARATDFVELCDYFGYSAEEHIVQTKDGYLLGIHRLGWKRGQEGLRVNSGPGSVQKKVVYLHHGLLMNSEVWVCLTDRERCLPFLLVGMGYDVWVCAINPPRVTKAGDPRVARSGWLI